MLSSGLSAGTLLTGVLTFAGAGGGALLLGLLRRRPELQALDDQAKGQRMGGEALLITAASESAAGSARRAEAAEKRLSELYRESAERQDLLTEQITTLQKDLRATRKHLEETQQQIAQLQHELVEARNTVAVLSRIAKQVDAGAATGLRVEAEQGAVRDDLGESRGRADAVVGGEPGAAADAASHTPAGPA